MVWVFWCAALAPAAATSSRAEMASRAMASFRGRFMAGNLLAPTAGGAQDRTPGQWRATRSAARSARAVSGAATGRPAPASARIVAATESASASGA